MLNQQLLMAACGARAAGVLWTPADLPTPPAVWIDDDSSLTDVSGFCSSISSHDSSISGAFTQGTAANRPAINATGIGGRRTLDFDGTLDANGDRMTSTAFNSLFRNVGIGWIFSVYDKIAADGVDTPRTFAEWSETSAAGARAALVAGRGSGGLRNTPSITAKRVDAAGETTVSSVNGERSDPVMMMGHFNWTGNTQTLYLDGASDNSGSIAASGGNTSNTDSNLAEIGARSSTNAANADVRLACLIAGAWAIGTDDIDRLFGWAAHRWGLTANLPGGHPYKSSPP